MPFTIPSTAWSRAASANTMLAALPPSSRVSRRPVPASSVAIRLPTAVEPVNATFARSGCATSAAPVSGPPVTTFSTPGGSPASSAISASSSAVSGVVSAGFSTTVLPHASAGAIFQAAISSGKFHGITAPQTPSERASRPGTAYWSLSAQPAWWNRCAATSGTSTSRDSRIGLPPSSDSATASSRDFSCTSRAIRYRCLPRSAAGSRDHGPYASRAAATAAATSAFVPSVISAIGSSVAGFSVGTRAPPFDRRQAPPMNRSYFAFSAGRTDSGAGAYSNTAIAAHPTAHRHRPGPGARAASGRCEDALEARHDGLGERAVDLGLVVRDMRRDDHPRVLEQARVDLRLVREHVQTGTPQPARIERGQQRLLVDDRPAGRVDQHGVRPQQCELALADQAAGVVRQGAVDRDVVRLPQQVVERHLLDPGLRSRRPVPGH